MLFYAISQIAKRKNDAVANNWPFPTIRLWNELLLIKTGQVFGDRRGRKNVLASDAQALRL